MARWIPKSTHLKMRAGDAFCQLLEEWGHDLVELSWFDDVQNLLQLIEEHYLQTELTISVKLGLGIQSSDSEFHLQTSFGLCTLGQNLSRPKITWKQTGEFVRAFAAKGGGIFEGRPVL